MKRVVVGVVALPVAVAGFGVAAAAILSPDPPEFGPGGTLPSVHEAITGSTDVSALGTSIDGRRPHLTVVDGSSSVILPGSLPGIVTMLPRTVYTLPDDTPALTGVPGAEQPETDRPDHADTTSPQR